MTRARLGQQLTDCVPTLFARGDSLGDELLELASHWREEETSTERAVPTLALLGLEGEARRTALSALSTDSSSLTEFDANRSRGLWLGPVLPAHEPDHTRLRRIESSALSGLGRDWNLWLPPTSQLPDLGEASAVILALEFEQLRDGRFEDLLSRARGLPLQPLILFQPSPDSLEPSDSQRKDYQEQLEVWAKLVANEDLASPVWIPDPRLVGSENSLTVSRQNLATALRPLLANDELLARARRRHAQAELADARAQLSKLLRPWRARLGAPLERLDELTHSLPNLVEDQLIGEEPLLRAGLRGRFRADLLERAPLWFFPLRSLLGILTLTLGAWDRVVFASFGSIPSLVGATVSGWKQWRESGQLGQKMQPGLRGRLENLLAESYAPDLSRFAQALASAGGTEIKPGDQSSTQVSVHGLDGLESSARDHLSQGVIKHRLGAFALILLAFSATTLFWLLLSGPLITIYRDYLEPLVQSWQQLIAAASPQAGSPLSPGPETIPAPEITHNSFPSPDFSYWLTAVLLSLGPVLILAMTIVALACSAQRVRRAASEFRVTLRGEIKARLSQSQLRIQLYDPQIEAARQLAALSHTKPPPNTETTQAALLR